MSNISFEDIKNSEEIKTYIRHADATLLSLGYTEHSFAHVMRCADLASKWLLSLGHSEKEADLARIAAYMHDIGNVVNRVGHAHNGALLSQNILSRMNMPPEDIATVISAIGHHDEKTAYPISAVSAALILADKTDVRRSRVRNTNDISFDIHDRVNYAVERASTTLNIDKMHIRLSLEIDTSICDVLEYFEIFLERMLLCRKAADYFGLKFKLDINGSRMM